MPEQPKITERQIAAFISEKRTDSGVSRRLSNPKYCFTFDLNRPRTDLHLENTLVNNIGINKPLTKREIRILCSILAGKNNKQIALMLSGSCRTIEYRSAFWSHRCRSNCGLNGKNYCPYINSYTIWCSFLAELSM
jgi:hypothetical protein